MKRRFLVHLPTYRLNWLIDYTIDAVTKIIEELCGDEADEVLQCRYQALK